MRYLFRTILLHSCYNIELGERLPQKCRCRKLISKEDASALVKTGRAEWVVGMDGIPTWDVCLVGRGNKTPRAATIEKAHMQRAFGGEIDDAGEWVRKVESSLDDDGLNEREDIEIDGMISLESRLELFACRKELADLKAFSDKLNRSALDSLEGLSAMRTDRKVSEEADKLKFEVAKDDPDPGRAVIVMIGLDQRSFPR